MTEKTKGGGKMSASLEVELIAITQFLKASGSENPLDEFIEFAGRLCYRSMPWGGGEASKYVMQRVHDGHGSIIEHPSATFLVTGISRACSHQIVRHRIASYSQESQRYVDMQDSDFVTPPAIAGNDEAMIVWNAFINQCTLVYSEFRDLGIRKEDARFVLPNATATKILITMNFRSFRHFFEMRCKKDAQWEIRNVALKMLDELFWYCPGVFTDLYERFLID
ncbi:MAG: FAD-dependent thymidylate synthase [Patescibacteria group bacterium]|nr:FAD-dependent thymidylate synthase [Patescibacteria group bacterium]